MSLHVCRRIAFVTTLGVASLATTITATARSGPLDPELAACAPHVNSSTLAHIIRVESGFNPLAINVNAIRGRPRYRHPRVQTRDQGARIVRDAISQGYNVDIGLMQVNSRNLRGLGYSIEQMFLPCENIRAGAAILTDNYLRARRHHGEGQRALLAALSAYNTGSFTRGFDNGYVGRYFNMQYAISTPVTARSGPSSPVTSEAQNLDALNPYTSELSVYSRVRPENAQNIQQPSISPAGLFGAN